MNSSNSTTGTPSFDSDSSSSLKSSVSDAADSLASSARSVIDKAGDEVSNVADTAKRSFADQTGNVASALRTAADELRSGSAQERTFSQMADGLADMSDAVRDKDLGEIVDSLGGFARKNPMMFLGGAALLGFAATRFAKASGGRSHRTGNVTGSYGRPPVVTQSASSMNAEGKP